MGTPNDDILEAQLVELNDEQYTVEVAPVRQDRSRQVAVQQRLANVPAVKDLPTWEDGERRR